MPKEITLDTDHRTRRFTDDAVRMGAKTAEHAVLAAADDYKVGLVLSHGFAKRDIDVAGCQTDFEAGPGIPLQLLDFLARDIKKKTPKAGFCFRLGFRCWSRNGVKEH